MRHAVRHQPARVLASQVFGLLGIVAVGGCSDLFAPSSPTIFVLTSINGRPAAGVNLLEWYGYGDLYGSYVVIVSDSVMLYPNGRGERREVIRQLLIGPGVEGTPTEYRQSMRLSFQYWTEGTELRVLRDEHAVFCNPSCHTTRLGSEPELGWRRARWGALERDFGELGTFHYERASASAP